MCEDRPAGRDAADSSLFRAAMFEANPYINIIFDDTLRLVDCNPAAIGYFGYADKAALLENLVTLINDSIPAFQPDGSPSIPLSTRFDYVVEHGLIDFEVEMVLEGRRVPLRFTLKKIPHGDSYAIAGYILDMGQLKEARNELLRQDHLMRQINRAATKLMASDPESFVGTVHSALRTLGQSVYASQMYIWENYEEDGDLRCRELFLWDSGSGASDQRTRSLSYSDVPQWRDLLMTRKNINRLISRQVDEYEVLVVPRGTRALLLIPVFLRGSFWGFIGLNKNRNGDPFSATEEKIIQSGGILVVSSILRNQVNQNLIEAREAALASDRAKSEFLSRMSHEIRTPMNAIIGMTAIAQRNDDIEQIRYSLKNIDAASHQLLNIINDILDMSKIESGKLELAPTSFDLRQTLRSVYNVVKVRLEEKGQRYSIKLDDAFSRNICCDELRLSQVMINLLTNAVKFTPEGGEVAVEVTCRAREEANLLRVEVRDSGIGISAEQQARLFNSFEQADGSITRRFGGTGLGLAICKRIVGLMEGDIWVESDLGRGSSFFFEVAFHWGEACSQCVPPPTAVSVYAWPGRRLLIVEDVEINQEIILTILGDTGLEMTCAGNGLEAVALAEDRPWDLILMDVQMPELDGLEATRRIRALNVPWAKSVPILAMTANAFTEDVRKCLEAGMNDHVAKPIDIDALMDKLALYLE